MKTTKTNFDPLQNSRHGKFILQKEQESLCLMHRFFLLDFVFFMFSFCFLNTPVKNNKKCSPSLNIYTTEK